MKNLTRTSLIMAFLCIAAQACSSQPTESNEAIVGIYTTTTTYEDITSVGGSPTVAVLATGSWQLEFTPGGEYRLTRLTTNELEEVIPYHLNREDLLLEATTGDNACYPTQSEGTYQWRLDGNQLVLTAIQDDCYRKWLFIAKPWTKQP